MSDNTIFICMVQTKDRITGEWKNGSPYTRKTKESIKAIVELESRDTTCGGMVDWGTAGRRLWVRTTEVTSEEFIKLPN